MLTSLRRKRFRAAFALKLDNLKNVSPIWLKRYANNQSDVTKKIERFNLRLLTLIEKNIVVTRMPSLTQLLKKAVTGKSPVDLKTYLNELEEEMTSFFIEFKATPSLYIKRSKPVIAMDAMPSHTSDIIFVTPKSSSNVVISPVRQVAIKLRLSKDCKTVFKYEDKTLREQHTYSEAIREKIKRLFEHSKGSPSRPIAEEFLFGKNKYLSSWIDSYRQQVKTGEKMSSYNFLENSIFKATGKGKSRLIGFRYPTEIEP